MSKTAIFQNPIFQDETKAREALEAVRWPDGPVCPHCGSSHEDRSPRSRAKNSLTVPACSIAMTARANSLSL